MGNCGFLYTSDSEKKLRRNILHDYNLLIEYYKTGIKMRNNNLYPSLISDLESLEDTYRIKLFNYWEWPDLNNEKYRLKTIGYYYKILHRSRVIKDLVRRQEYDRILYVLEM